MTSTSGPIRTFYTKGRLPKYEVELRHYDLAKYQLIRGDDEHVVEQKALAKMQQWDEIWARKQEAEHKRREREQRAKKAQEKKDLAAERTEEAKTALETVDTVLAHALELDNTVDWESLKNFSDYSAPKPCKPSFPQKPAPSHKPKKPLTSDFPARLGILGRIFPSTRAAKELEAQKQFKEALTRWRKDCAEAIAAYNSQAQEYNTTVTEMAQEYKRAVAAWQEKRADYLKKRDQANAAIEQKKQKYTEGDPEAIRDYCDILLSNSKYPDGFPQSYELDYNPENKILIVEYEMPPIESMPTVKEVKYVQSRDEFDEKHVPDAELRRKYDNFLYQIALRTIHELYEADAIRRLASIVFNGYVSSVDRATGQQILPCVLSVQASREEFDQINLAVVNPKACFKKLKGVASSKLHTMTPIPPVLKIDREDGRFIEGRAVVDGITEGENLAAMDWQDFEHLIRELFEKEFGRGGGEVKITRTSRDGGVDAVVFDPDPLRGGKIVVQAKRYTNTVGVAAVRDLYGTVVNEGANKGVLVSTSDYGPDAYNFAKGKPLVLLNGGQLLHLLQKHGHRAKIDLAEAKQILSEGDSS